MQARTLHGCAGASAPGLMAARLAEGTGQAIL